MTEKLKVAYYLQRFPSLTETFILREMLALRELGLDIQVFSLMTPFQYSTMHEQVQVMMPYVHYSPFLFSLKLIQAQFYFLLRFPLRYIRALRHAVWQTSPVLSDFLKMLLIFPKSVYFAQQLTELKIDHLHVHFIWLGAIAARVANDLTGITYSLHAHAWDIFQRNPKSIRRQLEMATGVVTISEYHRQYLSRICPYRQSKDIYVVRCGLDPVEFSPARVNDVDQPMLIISVGSLIEKKGHEYLIDACVRLINKGYRFHCSIIGSGPLSKALQARIEKHNLLDYVSILGAKNQAEVQGFYRKSSIFVLACVVAKNGDRDGIPVALMEAMAMQLPVITTPVAGIPELVVDEKTGLLVPERDAHALELAIERLIADSALRSRLGQQGRQVVLADYDIHHTARQMASIFRGIKGISSDINKGYPDTYLHK